MKTIKAVSLDIDGTLVSQGQPVPGAVATINALREQGLQLRLLTNMTGRSPADVSTWLGTLGFVIKPEEIHTSVSACLRYLADQRQCRCMLALPEGTKSQFTALEQDDKQPTHVILGDLNEGFDYPLLNKVFRCLEAGAQLVAFHRNPYFFSAGEKWLDSGMFTLGLEAATGQKAIITGKPSNWFYEGVLQSLSLSSEEVIFVGDDVATDILGANAINAYSVLVKTGKFKLEHLEDKNPQAKAVVESVGDLGTILGAL